MLVMLVVIFVLREVIKQYFLRLNLCISQDFSNFCNVYWYDKFILIELLVLSK